MGRGIGSGLESIGACRAFSSVRFTGNSRALGQKKPRRPGAWDDAATGNLPANYPRRIALRPSGVIAPAFVIKPSAASASRVGW